MNNTVESIGLHVLSVSPINKEKDVNVHSDITITFDSDVDIGTFNRNIVVLQDINGIYDGVTSLNDYSKYAVVKGSIAYADRVLTYTPEKPFDTDTCYILLLNDNITDITGNKLVKKSITCFYTEAVASYPKCVFTSPKYGCITSNVPEFEWENLNAPSYIFQVSKINSFESLLCDEPINGNEVSEHISYAPDPSIFNNEGVYFIRVKAENGQWSNVHQIFIKPITDAVVAHEDTPEIQNLQEFLDGINEELVILERFPVPDSINNPLNTNVIYVKFQGKVDESLLDIDNSWVYGESDDEDHEKYSQGELPGSWSVIYDSYYDVTYVIFTPFDSDIIQDDELVDDEPNIEPSEPSEQEEPINEEPNTPTEPIEGENGNTGDTEEEPSGELPDELDVEEGD